MHLRFLALIFSGFSILLLPLDSFSQPRCPLGTMPGSMDCSVRGHHVVRYEGYGAYVKSMSGDTTYWVTGADSGGLAGVTADAMTACRRAGNDDCEVLGTWRNSCASVGSVNLEGIKHRIFRTGSNGRASRRAVRQECSAISPSAECKVHKAVCIDFRTDLVPYY